VHHGAGTARTLWFSGAMVEGDKGQLTRGLRTPSGGHWRTRVVCEQRMVYRPPVLRGHRQEGHGQTWAGGEPKEVESAVLGY
jgi:hypothetical protein